MLSEYNITSISFTVFISHCLKADWKPSVSLTKVIHVRCREGVCVPMTVLQVHARLHLTVGHSKEILKHN